MVALLVVVISPDALIVVTPDKAPEDIVADPSVKLPPVIAPEALIVVTPDKAPEDIVADPVSYTHLTLPTTPYV